MNHTHHSSLPSSIALRRTLALIAACAGIFWCVRWWRGPTETDHRHVPGSHGGIIVAVGHEHYHVEALFEKGGVLRLFTLGQDQTQVITVPTQQLTAFVRTAESIESVGFPLESRPQSGDPEGQTSAFEGHMPLELTGSQLMVIVPSITIDNRRYRFGFMTQAGHDAEMPQKVSREAERELYLTPGGKYTTADITANGSMTASQKYRGFRSIHDMNPARGDAICPITRTKANPNCTWMVNGHQHTFCCPPCIDEFVKLAKEHPDEIQDPPAYVLQ